MKNTLNQIAFILILLVFSMPANAQINGHFYKIKLKKENLRVAFDNPEFHHFKFILKETGQSNHYILTGQAYKEDDEVIGEAFDVSKPLFGGKVDLPNLEMGTYTLFKSKMDSVDMERNKNYKFTPRKYKNERNEFEDYVSYFVHEKGPGNADEEPQYPSQNMILAFRTFKLDPSPPATPQ